MNACVIIPTYNEAHTIADLVKGTKKLGLDVIVTDDGSFDTTARIAEGEGAHVLRNDKNKGKGAALRKAFLYAIKNDYDGAVTMDGDAQHDPEEIATFLQRAGVCDAGVIVGNRMRGSTHMPKVRRITNKLMSTLISMIIRQDVPDTQCGFRFIRRNVLEDMVLRTSKFEIDSEILIEASRSGYKIDSIPIKIIYQGQASQIKPIVDTLRFLWFISRIIFKR